MASSNYRFKRICFIVLDSVGIGEAPDAAEFGDQGSHTLGHILERVQDLKLPHLQQMGLGNITSIPPLSAVEKPIAFHGKMQEVSIGKDTMTGHWELMGLKIETPFNTYPGGFPEELIKKFEEETGRKVIGNKPASGTDILVEYGEEQMKTGAWIIYTSADSVLQIAAHEEVIPLEELYKGCEIARRLTMAPEFSVGRVIARPYVGVPGNFTRTPNRHDYAVKPPEATVMNAVQAMGKDVISVGKIHDIFTGEGITESYSTKSNEHGIQVTIDQLSKDFNGLLFTNLVDFDSLYGHRRDPEGYGRALEAFDQSLPELMAQLNEDDLLIISADHGNDPVHSGTDHTREYVPLLVYSPFLEETSSLGIRQTFSDIGATIADNFGAEAPKYGTSFLQELLEPKEANTMGQLNSQMIQEAAAYISSKSNILPEVGLILGSGLGVLAELIEDGVSIPYEDIPHFPVSTVEGHDGELLLGIMNGRPVVMMKGRFHMYEGYGPEVTAFPVRVMKELGVKSLLVTNAAGGVNKEFEPGDLMLITDHLNLTGTNPLIGRNDAALGVRFPDMSEAYSQRLRKIAKNIAKLRGFKLKKGIYAGLLGPSYETPAEIVMLRTLGADAVGMSTVSEVIVARHAGIEVLGITCITNMASGILDQPLSHDEVMETSERVREKFSGLVVDLIPQM